MTNAEYILQSKEHLVDFVLKSMDDGDMCDVCKYKVDICDIPRDCRIGHKKWLDSPYDKKFWEV